MDKWYILRTCSSESPPIVSPFRLVIVWSAIRFCHVYQRDPRPHISLSPTPILSAYFTYTYIYAEPLSATPSLALSTIIQTWKRQPPH
ncbi:hypothetical protein BJ165DRAFT_1500115 [Panaeolus papilionaceus]|nr:hypothetical protein BJ165DRAFT_1500115 [Panaeolus papilionaceus]